MWRVLDIPFALYAPTSLLGLLGLLFAYLYGFSRNKDNAKLNQLKAIHPSERIRVVEMMLNDLGVQIDTSSLTSKQKYELVVKLLNAKTKRYFIISITTIILSVIIAIMILPNSHGSDKPESDTPEAKGRASSMKPDTVERIGTTTDTLKAGPHLNNEKPTQGVDSKEVRLKRVKPKPVEKFTVHIRSLDIKSSEVWLDDKPLGVYDFRNGNEEYATIILYIPKGLHMLEFKRYVVERSRIQYEPKDQLGWSTHNINTERNTYYDLTLARFYKDDHNVYYTELEGGN